MSKAEEQALKAYPRADDAWGDEWQKRVGFVEGYKQAEKDFIEKACMWLRENTDEYLYNTGGKYNIPTCSGKMIDDFRAYIEGELL